jgi:hypothetical protein
MGTSRTWTGASQGGQRAGVVLQHDGHEPLDGAEQRPMDHERAVASVVGAGVLQVESVRKLEVDLERRDLPAPSDRVADVHVDLGRVEGALPLGHEVVEARGVQRLLQGGLGLVPFLRGADERLRTGRQLRLELGQPEGAEQAQDELQQAGQLAAQLLTGAEDMGIVWGLWTWRPATEPCPCLPDGINRAMSTASGQERDQR